MKRTLFLVCVLTVGLVWPTCAQNLAVGTISTFSGTVSVKGANVTGSGGQAVIGVSGDLYAGIWGVIAPFGAVTVEEPTGLPLKWEIGLAYPNPFNPSVAFAVSLPVASFVKAEVYNVLGQRVEVLVNGPMSQGWHRLVWNANRYSSGVYFLRAEIPERMQKIQRVVLVR